MKDDSQRHGPSGGTGSQVLADTTGTSLLQVGSAVVATQQLGSLAKKLTSTFQLHVYPTTATLKLVESAFTWCKYLVIKPTVFSPRCVSESPGGPRKHPETSACWNRKRRTWVLIGPLRRFWGPLKCKNHWFQPGPQGLSVSVHLTPLGILFNCFSSLAVGLGLWLWWVSRWDQYNQSMGQLWGVRAPRQDLLISRWFHRGSAGAALLGPAFPWLPGSYRNQSMPASVTYRL